MHVVNIEKNVRSLGKLNKLRMAVITGERRRGKTCQEASKSFQYFSNSFFLLKSILTTFGSLKT